jgi:hypothetical protein
MHGVTHALGVMSYLSDMDEVSGDLGSRNMPGMSKTPGVSGMPVVQALVMDGSWLGGVGGHQIISPFWAHPIHPLPHPALY